MYQFLLQHYHLILGNSERAVQRYGYPSGSNYYGYDDYGTYTNQNQQIEPSRRQSSLIDVLVRGRKICSTNRTSLVVFDISCFHKVYLVIIFLISKLKC